MFTRLICGVAVVSLSACVSLNPVTLVQLATLDPFSADPTQMAVQMDLPDGAGVAEGSAFMRLEAQFIGDSFDERFLLTEAEDEVWRIDSADRDRFYAVQDRAIAWERANAEESSGSFSVGFEPCAIGDGPDEDARVSLRIQLEPTARFLPLFTDVPVSDFYAEEDIDALRDCAQAASAD